jgi:hypothetical protein
MLNSLDSNFNAQAAPTNLSRGLRLLAVFPLQSNSSASAFIRRRATAHSSPASLPGCLWRCAKYFAFGALIRPAVNNEGADIGERVFNRNEYNVKR